MNDLTAVMLVHNVQLYKYPWAFGFASALPVVKKFVFVVAGPHQDKTDELVDAQGWLFPDKVIVVAGEDYMNGVHPTSVPYPLYRYPDIVWPNDQERLADLVNAGFDHAETEWVFQLQGDEILSEKDYPEFDIIKYLPLEYEAVSWRFRHYCGDEKHVFHFMYASADFEDVDLPNYPRGIVRCCRAWSNFVNAGDAVQLVGTGKAYHSQVIIHHCGKIHAHREHEAAEKEHAFQTRLYAKYFDEDPKVLAAYQAGAIDYFNVFETSMVREYNGPWPREMLAWLASLEKENSKVLP